MTTKAVVTDHHYCIVSGLQRTTITKTMKAIAVMNGISPQRNLDSIERFPTFPYQRHHLSPQILAGARFVTVAIIAVLCS